MGVANYVQVHIQAHHVVGKSNQTCRANNIKSKGGAKLGQDECPPPCPPERNPGTS